LWKCEDLQADDTVDDDGDNELDEWSTFTGVGCSTQSGHVACRSSRVWPTVFFGVKRRSFFHLLRALSHNRNLKIKLFKFTW